MHISLITSAVTKRREAQWSTIFSLFFVFQESCCCLWNNINSIFWWTKINNSEWGFFFVASWLQIKWVKKWSYKALSVCMMLLLKFTLICIRSQFCVNDDDDEARKIFTPAHDWPFGDNTIHTVALWKKRVYWRIFP